MWKAFTYGSGLVGLLQRDFTVTGRSSLGISSLRRSNSCLVSIICRSTWIISQLIRLATSNRSVYATFISSVISFNFNCTFTRITKDQEIDEMSFVQRCFSASRRELRHSSCFTNNLSRLVCQITVFSNISFSIFFQELGFLRSQDSSLMLNLSMRFSANKLIFFSVPLLPLWMGCMTAFMYFYEQNFILF